MTVYVDNMRMPFGRMLMCHMGADGFDELHAMVDKIGIARKHFQGDHYDICQSKRQEAINNGAVPISVRQMAKLVKKGKSPTTYQVPEHGWACFHCGETFTNPTLAKTHFGPSPEATSACVMRSERGLVYRLRELEQDRDEWKARTVALRSGCDPVDAVMRLRARRDIQKI